MHICCLVYKHKSPPSSKNCPASRFPKNRFASRPPVAYNRPMGSGTIVPRETEKDRGSMIFGAKGRLSQREWRILFRSGRAKREPYIYVVGSEE